MPLEYPDSAWPPSQLQKLSATLQSLRKKLDRNLFRVQDPTSGATAKYQQPIGATGPSNLPDNYAVAALPLFISLVAYNGSPIQFTHNLGYVPVSIYPLAGAVSAVSDDANYKWTRERIFLQTTELVYPVRVTFLLY